MEPVQAPRPAAPTRRVRQNFTCVGCGYNIRGQAVDSLCPECGTPVMHSMGQPAPTSGYAIASMVIGILSLMSCILYGVPSVILGPIALVLAHTAKKKEKQGLVGGSTRGMATAGFWCGLIATVLGGLGLIIVGLMFAGLLFPGQFP